MVVLPQNGEFALKWKYESEETAVRMGILNTLTWYQYSPPTFTVETAVLLRPIHVLLFKVMMCPDDNI
jgi:hypothetical protein